MRPPTQPTRRSLTTTSVLALLAYAPQTTSNPTLPRIPQAHALFESNQQLAVTQQATALAKLKDVIAETADVQRLRAKLPLDPADDAYALRFTRSVLAPLKKTFDDASESGSAPPELIADFEASLAALDTACRERNVDAELEGMRALESMLATAVAEGKERKYDVKPNAGDINSYNAGAEFVYNKWLFRAG